MKAMCFFRVAIILLLLSLSSCKKETDIYLSIEDLVGTWKTDYFDKSPFYGPMAITFRDDYTLTIHYKKTLDDGPMFNVYVLSMFDIDGNKINYCGSDGNTSTLLIKSFSGNTMKFRMSDHEINLTLEAEKIE